MSKTTIKVISTSFIIYLNTLNIVQGQEMTVNQIVTEILSDSDEYQDAEKAYAKREWEMAKEYYEDFFAIFIYDWEWLAEGKPKLLRVTEIIKKDTNEKIEICERKIKRANKGYGGGFVFYTYDKEAPISLSAGQFHKQGIGGYFTIRMNTTPFFNAAYEIDESGNSDSHVISRATGTVKNAIISGSAGINKLITYPLWAYLGVGIGNYKYQGEYDAASYGFGGNLNNVEPEYFKNTDKSGLVFYPEIGLNIKVSNSFALKLGIMYTDKVIAQFGFGVVF